MNILIIDDDVSLTLMASRGYSSGTGLGLAIAKQTVIADGGTVFLRNADTGGFSITIQLQVAPPTNQLKPIAEASTPNLR